MSIFYKEILGKWAIPMTELKIPHLPCPRYCDKGTLQVGQVGLSGDENGLYLSVFFPDKKEPAFSYDTPLEKLTSEELGCIVRNLKKS